jgi:hypothetical protein
LSLIRVATRFGRPVGLLGRALEARLRIGGAPDSAILGRLGERRAPPGAGVIMIAMIARGSEQTIRRRGTVLGRSHGIVTRVVPEQAPAGIAA